ncbi:MAG TPA: histidine phosphatase family protein, partial [Gemmata sp.]|nr:histidine phosphatase family protein [Gemmata sp.]
IYGETEWSRNGRHTGRTDLPLTAAGEEDGRQLGTKLAGITFSRVFSSPLSRARRTAELAGFAPEIEPDLIEWNYGDYEGKTSSEIRASRPDWLLFRDGCPGGESPADIAARADRLAAKLKALSGNILCFAHGHLLRVLAARWVNQPVAFAACLLLGTATLSVLSFDHARLEEPAIKMWNAS